MIFKANNKTIDIYDYYVTNALVLKFRDVSDKKIIEDFFNSLGDVTSFDIIDEETNKIKNHYQLDLQYNHYSVENTEIIEYEYQTIQEAWDEVIENDNSINEETSPLSDGDDTTEDDAPVDLDKDNTQIIHHEAIIQKVEKRIPAEITSVFLEKPSVEMSISSVKSQVKDIQNIFPNIDQFQIFMSIQCDSLTDEQALLVSDYYEAWDTIPVGTELKEGKRVRYLVDGLLYKVKEGKTHNKQDDWNPKDATSLFDVIEPNHAGTKEDPIPAHANMKYFKDKYYIENDVIYLCNSELAANGVVLAYTPSQLVNIYFVIAE